MTVAPTIAQRYHASYGLDPVVVMNIPEKTAFSAHVTSEDNIRLVHHGGASRDRHLELMIDALAMTDERYSLHFMLVPQSPGYLEYLGKLVARKAPGRVIFHEPVSPDKITREISQYDIGLYILEPTSYNKKVALPNKFFDFIAAGLAVCIGPSPSMADLVQRYRVGCVAPSFGPDDVAATLNALDAGRVTAMQEAARRAASQDLSGVHVMDELLKAVGRLW
jgi:hypothetical protein